MEGFDPRKNVLETILKDARAGLAGELKEKYAPTPNLEATAIEPVPGAEPAEEEEDDLPGMLEQMVSQ